MAAIVTAVTIFKFLGNLPPPFFPTTYAGSCTLLCFSIMYSWYSASSAAYFQSYRDDFMQCEVIIPQRQGAIFGNAEEPSLYSLTSPYGPAAAEEILG